MQSVFLGSWQKSIFCFFYIYMTVFGPKLFGFCDLSVLTSSVMLLYFLTKGKVYEYTRTLIIVLSLIVVYILIVSLFFDKVLDYIFLLKFIRVLLAVLCISNFVESGLVNKDSIRNSLVNVLLLHATVVIVGSTFYLHLQDVVRPLNGFERIPMYFRSPGLTNGYDFSGLLCIFGLLLAYLGKSTELKKIKIIVFIVAALLTSRMNMLLLEMIMLFLLLFFRKKNFQYACILCVFFAVSVVPAMGIFLITTQNTNNIIVETLMKNEFFSGFSSELVYHYTTTDIDYTVSNHFDFSRLTDLQFIMGAMQKSNFDPGYTQYIYKIGILGLFVTCLFYVKIIVQAINFRYVSKEDALVVVIICLLCLLMSIKNSYLLARHVTESLLIIYSLLCSNHNKIKFVSQK